MNTWQLCVQLDTSTTLPTVVDVDIMCFGSNPMYRIINAKGPYAMLTEVTCRSGQEAQAALRGLIEKEKDLAWVLQYDSVRRFLNPSPMDY